MRIKFTDPKLTSLQEVFDFVARHLLTQNQRCMHGSACLLRNDFKDLCCAVGCLISAEDYRPFHEKFSWQFYRLPLHIDFGKFSIAETETLWNLLESLQRCHDNNNSTSWPNILVNIATRNNLTLIKKLESINENPNTSPN